MHTLIVGASRGLGLCLVQRLLSQGQHVTALFGSSAPQLEALMPQAGGRLTCLRADVRDEDSLRAVAQRLQEQGRVLDRLIYNAAIHLEQERSDILGSNIDDIKETLDVNSIGALRAVKQLRPLLAEGGQLVLISSEAGSIGDCWRDSEYGYCMSKAAMNMFAQLMAHRESKRSSRVEVRAIHPGWLRTDMGGPDAHDSPEEAAQQLLETLATPPQAVYTDRHGAPMNW